MIFKGLSMKQTTQNFLKGESPTLKELFKTHKCLYQIVLFVVTENRRSLKIKRSIKQLF